MASSLVNKRILLGVTGSIAAYKSADLVRRLRELSAEVRVVMTVNAHQFITPLTMQAVSGQPIHSDLFDLQAEAAMGHIELARWADVILIAPCSADCMARLALGNANDLLSTICLAAHDTPIVIAPAMNQGMWRQTLTQVQQLQAKKITIWGPAEGSQACGDIGPGRMLEPAEIAQKLTNLFSTGDLAGLRILVTAGPTHEAIDPVRYLTNGSSGKMGYALCEAAQEAGAKVTLISGPTNLKIPEQVEFISVISAGEMHAAVMKLVHHCDIFLAVAAVSDYCPQSVAKQKMHKSDDILNLKLLPTPDIVHDVGQLPSKPFIVGFAAETENVIENARKKRERKCMDIIIANQVAKGIGIGSDDNQVTVIGIGETQLPKMSKHKLARQLIKLIADEFKKRATI